MNRRSGRQGRRRARAAWPAWAPAPSAAWALIACLAATAGAAGADAGRYAPAERMCGFADPRIDESSGVTSASWADDVVWTHNDSGDSARFFAVGTDDCETIAEYTLSGVEARDWEDMARAGTTLYFGDIGDNAERRDHVRVHEVPEPTRGSSSGPVRPTSTRTLRYPDGAHNAESLLVDPTTGRLVIITKTRAGLGTVYRAPESAEGTMEKVAELSPGPDARGLSGKAAVLATGADATAGRLVVRTYVGGFEWELPEGEDLHRALSRPPTQVALPITVQGESIGYTRDGSDLWITSEGESGPIHRLAAAPAEDRTTPTTGEPGGAGTDDEAASEGDDGGGAPPGLVLAGVVVAAALVAGLVRKGRTRPI